MPRFSCPVTNPFTLTAQNEKTCWSFFLPVLPVLSEEHRTSRNACCDFKLQTGRHETFNFTHFKVKWAAGHGNTLLLSLGPLPTVITRVNTVLQERSDSSYMFSVVQPYNCRTTTPPPLLSTAHLNILLQLETLKIYVSYLFKHAQMCVFVVPVWVKKGGCYRD